eukprot:6686373-Prymnesium_polylepis.3
MQVSRRSVAKSHDLLVRAFVVGTDGHDCGLPSVVRFRSGRHACTAGDAIARNPMECVQSVSPIKKPQH